MFCTLYACISYSVLCTISARAEPTKLWVYMLLLVLLLLLSWYTPASPLIITGIQAQLPIHIRGFHSQSVLLLTERAANNKHGAVLTSRESTLHQWTRADPERSSYSSTS